MTALTSAYFQLAKFRVCWTRPLAWQPTGPTHLPGLGLPRCPAVRLPARLAVWPSASLVARLLSQVRNSQ